MMRALLDAIPRTSSLFDVPVPREFARDAQWVEPQLVGEVEFREWTGDGVLRHPSWRGLRPDRVPTDVTLPTVDARQ